VRQVMQRSKSAHLMWLIGFSN